MREFEKPLLLVLSSESIFKEEQGQNAAQYINSRAVNICAPLTSWQLRDTLFHVSFDNERHKKVAGQCRGESSGMFENTLMDKPTSKWVSL